MAFRFGPKIDGVLCVALALAAQGARPAVAQETAGEPPVAAPRISVPQKEVDLGELIKGDIAEAQFRLENTGDAVLEIIRVKPG
jgi:hypothetical protein